MTERKCKAETKKNYTMKAETGEMKAVMDKDETVNSEAFDLVDAGNKILDECKDKFAALVVIGLNKDGNIDIVPTVPRYDFLFELLTRAEFELLLHQKNSIENAKQ